ncbi:hypothetical protein [Heyndrickxia oleronia]|uniref:Uncharacterized protein n=1 Tax=Heyndrickxia oleronia TaxID=38875 RepID=A0AAW6SSM4_9BACI|nr:hypothetical protein [Heyndrickxia oleronia]MDH5159826.1 hypothetical protein [Heyndrickxia oleronia]
MAVYKSKYRELKFYVDGELHAFSSGSFSTNDAKVIAVLDGLTDAKRVDEPKTEEVAPKPKAPAKKKSSGK